MIAKQSTPEWVHWLNMFTKPVTDSWKRAITQSIPFALRNALARDPMAAVFMGEGPEAWVPGIYLLTGLLNRTTGKVVGPRRSGEILAKAMDTAYSHEQMVRHNAFVRMLREGLYVEGFQGFRRGEDWASLPGWFNSLLLKPVDLINFITGGRWLAETTENAAREGAWIWAKKHGETDEGANYAYSVTTGNFGEHSGLPELRAIFRLPGFLNAAIQITYRQWRKFTDPDPKKRGGAWLRLAGLGMMAAGGWALNEMISDDKDRQKRKQLSEKQRATTMTVKGLNVPFDPGFIGGVQSYVWNHLDEVAGGMPIQNRKAFASALFANAMSAPGELGDFLPPLLRVSEELKANRVYYTGQAIVPWWLENLPAEEQRKAQTPEFYRQLAHLTDYPALKLEHVVRNGLARQLDEVIQLVDKLEKGRPIIREKADIPIVGRLFMRDPTGWGAASVRNVEELDKEYTALWARCRKLPEIQWKQIDVQLDQLQDLHAAAKELAKEGERLRRDEEDGEWDLVEERKTWMVQRAEMVMSNSQAYGKVKDALRKTWDEIHKAEKGK
jgi:hypothetical protein